MTGRPFLIRLIRLPLDLLLLTYDYLRLWYWLFSLGIQRAAGVWVENFGPFRCGLDANQAGEPLCAAVRRYGSRTLFRWLCPGFLIAPEIDSRPLCGMMPEGFGRPWSRIFALGAALLAVWGTLAGAGLWVYLDRVGPLFPAAGTGAPSGLPRTDRIHLPARSLAFLKTAERLLADGDYRKALIQYRNAVQHDNTNAEAHAGLGICLLRLEQFAEAENTLRTAVSLGTRQIDPLVELGQITLAMGRPREALTWSMRALQQDPSHPRALLLKAEILVQAGQRQEALDLTTRALHHPDATVDLRLWGAKVKVKAGDPSGARTLIETVLKTDPDHMEARIGLASILRLQGLPNEARQQLDGVLAVSAHNAKARVELAELHLDQGAIDHAIDLYRQLAASHSQFYAARARMADLMLYAGRIDEAHEAATQLVTEQPGSVRGHLVLASLYAGRDLYSLAIDHSRAVLKLVADHPQAQRLLAVCLAATRNYSEALKACDQALAAAPGDLNWLLLRGRLQMAAGNDEMARSDFRAAAAAHPDSALPALFQGQYLLARKRYDEAIDIYEQALARAPANFTAANNLANLLLDAGRDIDRAHAIARDLITRHPLSPVAADTFGWAAYRRNDLKTALTHLAVAARQLPAHPVVRYHYGQALLDSGDRQGARRELEAALHDRQDFRERAQARSLLEQIVKTTSKAP